MPAKELPVAEIQYACRMGFLTKSIWKEFFAKGGRRWQDRRWGNLVSSGVFFRKERMPDVLVPNPKHPLVREWVADVVRPPRSEQLYHDEVVGRTLISLKRSGS